jgi:hypothetical protein
MIEILLGSALPAGKLAHWPGLDIQEGIAPHNAISAIEVDNDWDSAAQARIPMEDCAASIWKDQNSARIDISKL